MQANGRQHEREPDGASVHYERHRPEQTTLYRLVQQHAPTLFARAEDAAVLCFNGPVITEIDNGTY